MAKFAYAGWNCKTCGEEIPFSFMGRAPLKGKTLINVPPVVLVQCGKCGQKHDYSHVLYLSKKIEPDQKSN